MENENYKYIKRNNPVISLIDLRMEYICNTGSQIPLNHDFCDDVSYILWLEDEIIKLKNLKRKLIPFENELRR